jgi:hypothetical protein
MRPCSPPPASFRSNLQRRATRRGSRSQSVGRPPKQPWCLCAHKKQSRKSAGARAIRPSEQWAAGRAARWRRPVFGPKQESGPPRPLIVQGGRGALDRRDARSRLNAGGCASMCRPRLASIGLVLRGHPPIWRARARFIRPRVPVAVSASTTAQVDVADFPVRRLDVLSTCRRLARVRGSCSSASNRSSTGAHQAGGAAGAGGLGCQAAYRSRNQSTVRLTAARCGVGSNGPKERARVRGAGQVRLPFPSGPRGGPRGRVKKA